jgi:hypothetical protein
LKSLSTRDRYSNQVTAQLTRSFNQVEDKIARAILKYRSLGLLPENQLVAPNGLEKLQDEITDSIDRLKLEQTLV